MGARARSTIFLDLDLVRLVDLLTGSSWDPLTGSRGDLSLLPLDPVGPSRPPVRALVRSQLGPGSFPWSKYLYTPLRIFLDPVSNESMSVRARDRAIRAQAGARPGRALVPA